MNSSSDNIIILRFAEARQPEYREKRGVGYIEFGQKNDYPNYLLDLYNKSAKHNAIVKGKVNYIIGNGWTGDNAQLIAHPNPTENLNDLTRKVSIDTELFGGYYLEVIWNIAGTQIAEIRHIDFTKVRTNKDNTVYYYRENWKYGSRDDIIEIPAFNPRFPVGRQILFVKEYRPGQETYPLPGYFGSLNYIESDVEVSKHVLGNAQTGFSASKLITLPNGEPSDDEKRKVTRQFENAFTGSDGKKFMLAFVQNTERKPIVDDLGASDLTKEDFTTVDGMIQQNIFAGHQITSPSLFGIAEPGKLGTRTEIRDAYEVFKNTYVNDKQMAIESTFNMLSSYMGGGALSIIPVEPIGFELTEATLLQIAPKEWLLEKAGIDVTKYAPTTVAGQPVTTAPAQASEMMVNENVKNLTGRQHQQLLRIIRQFSQGKITKEVAKTLLRTSLGLGEDEINTMLSIDDEEFIAHDEVDVFAEYGEPREKFNIHLSRSYQFAEAEIITDNTDKQILDILKRQPLTPLEDIAKAVSKEVADVTARVNRMTDGGIIAFDPKTNIRKVTQPISEIIDKPATRTFEVRYSYEWKPIVPSDQRDTPAHPSRAFCKKLMALDRFYTRKDIETISRRMGYDVFTRGGGWWGDSPSCRHEWRTNIVVRK